MTVQNAKRDLKITLQSEEDTAKLAQHFADCARPGMTILLDGPVGAGKTFFARSLIQNLLARDGVYEDIPSPTFTLVQSYHYSKFEIWHADLYRLSSPDELVELGLDTAFETALCLIEWPDRMGDITPTDATTITLQHGVHDTDRLCSIKADPDMITRLTMNWAHDD